MSALARSGLHPARSFPLPACAVDRSGSLVLNICLGVVVQGKHLAVHFMDVQRLSGADIHHFGLAMHFQLDLQPHVAVDHFVAAIVLASC
jgi:hypothetical protein